MALIETFPICLSCKVSLEKCWGFVAHSVYAAEVKSLTVGSPHLLREGVREKGGEAAEIPPSQIYHPAGCTNMPEADHLSFGCYPRSYSLTVVGAWC